MNHKPLITPTILWVQTLGSADEAYAIFQQAANAQLSTDVERIAFGAWACTGITIGGEFHSELNGAFLSAYSDINNDLLRLFALAKYESGDIRILKQDDITDLDYRLTVKDGSSELSDNLYKILEKVSTELVGKMSGQEIVITVIGLALIAGANFGFKAWLEKKKEESLEKIRSEERRSAIEALKFAGSVETSKFLTVVSAMQQSNELAHKALNTALNVNENILRAASKTPSTEISGNLLSQTEAKDLLGQSRRRAISKIIEQNMKVIDVNTSDPISTAVIIESPEESTQYRSRFLDRGLDQESRSAVFDALSKRGMAWFRLSIRQIGDDIVSVDILSAEKSRDEGDQLETARQAVSDRLN